MNSLLAFRDVWLIGGGGKTSLMYRLAAAWAARGDRVICTTTTRIWPPTPEQCADLRIASVETLEGDLRRRPAPMVTVCSGVQAGKCLGFSAEAARSLRELSDHLVVEADGSAGRPVKAHAAHEPVIDASASCVVAVVGAWCVGAPLDAEHVHRPGVFAERAGLALGAAVTADSVARVILGPDGWVGAVPAGAAFHIVVTGDDTELAPALSRHPNAGRIAELHRLSEGTP